MKPGEHCFSSIGIPGTIDSADMGIIAIAIKIMEVLFVVGGLGSAVVILLSGLEDIETAIEPDEPVAHDVA